MVTDVQVESIVSVGEGEFYDLNVPTEHHYITEGTVHHNSGKSDSLGLFCIVMYLSAPTETLCLLTSTTLEMAKLRVWKAVREYWNQVEHYFRLEARRLRKALHIPGKAVHSKGRIRGIDTAGELSDASGLVLVAADKKKGDEATSNVMGAKAPGEGLLILGADELPDLSPNLLTVADTNLVNNPMFWMYGIGNPNLLRDPHGEFCAPEAGWESVKHEPLEWRTKRGRCIRFESEQSSRVREEDDWTEKESLTKEPKCFWQPSRKVINNAAKLYGRKSRKFYRMYRGMWCQDKSPNAIYSENELLAAQEQQEPKWDNPHSLTLISGLDSAFTSGGDRNVALYALAGRVEGRHHLHFCKEETVEIDDAKELSPSHQIVAAWRKKCVSMGVRPRNAGYDNSGAGISFGHIVDMDWSTDVHKVNFGGAPSGRFFSLDGETKEEFHNRVSELWIQPKKYFRARQITGLTPRIVEDMVERQYDDRAEGKKLKVEKKAELKKRIGRSCDDGDAACIVVEVAILNGLLDSQEEKQIIRKANQQWKAVSKRLKIRSHTGRKLKF